MLDFAKYFSVFLVLCVAAASLTPPRAGGDWPEYTTTAVAMASHGTPGIRLSDVREAQASFPEGAVYYERIAARLDAPEGVPELGFHRARNGQVFAWHFFGYPALAAVPLAALGNFGLSPGRAFVLVNWAFVLVLALSLRRLFGPGWRAGLGVLLFVLTGGIGYSAWTSPEWACAAALLSALALFLSDAPLLAGLLAGFAASQNPSMTAFIGFAPLLRLIANWERGLPWLAQVGREWSARRAAGLAVAAAGAAAPFLFNQWAWGTPSLIASASTDRTLVTPERFLSYLFDLNQGLVIGFPAILAAMLLASRSRRDLLLAIVAVMFVAALALPTFTTYNWNSDASGVMRYAFWSAMPITFVLLLVLVPQAASRRWLVLPLVAVQALAAYGATTYSYLEMSPLAKLVLTKMPRAYDPEPEIFVERVSHAELMQKMDTHRVIVFEADGLPRKALVNRQHGMADADVELCGPGGRLSEYTVSGAGGGWRYLNGPFRCSH